MSMLLASMLAMRVTAHNDHPGTGIKLTTSQATTHTTKHTTTGHKETGGNAQTAAHACPGKPVGEYYYNGCNGCWCVEEHMALCTKMACL